MLRVSERPFSCAIRTHYLENKESIVRPAAGSLSVSIRPLKHPPDKPSRRRHTGLHVPSHVLIVRNKSGRRRLRDDLGRSVKRKESLKGVSLFLEMSDFFFFFSGK